MKSFHSKQIISINEAGFVTGSRKKPKAVVLSCFFKAVKDFTVTVFSCSSCSLSVEALY